MRQTCASCRQRASLSWRCEKRRPWCTGNSIQRGRRRWPWPRCWEMSARSTQRRVGVAHSIYHALNNDRLKTTHFWFCLWGKKKKAICRLPTRWLRVCYVCPDMCSCHVEDLSHYTAGLWSAPHSQCGGCFSPTGGTASRIPLPTSGQAQRVLESLVSKECK